MSRADKIEIAASGAALGSLAAGIGSAIVATTPLLAVAATLGLAAAAGEYYSRCAENSEPTRLPGESAASIRRSAT